MQKPLPKALQFLVHLQQEQNDPAIPKYSSRTILENYENQIRSSNSPEYISFLEKQIKAISLDLEHNIDINADGQFVFEFSQMEARKEEFDRIINSSFDKNILPYQVSPNVYFGTLELPSLSAMIRSVPDSSEFLILFNRGLWKFMEIISYLVATTVRYAGPYKPDKMYQDVFDLNLALFQEGVNLVCYGHCSISYPSIALDKIEDNRWSMVHNAIDDFVFGHEYAHFLHGHVSGANTYSRRQVVKGETSYSSSKTNWDMEYQADRTALDLSVFLNKDRFQKMVKKKRFDSSELKIFMESCLTEGTMLGLEGALLFLHSLCELERLQGIVFSTDSSHPPTWLRIHHIRCVLASQTNKRENQLSLQRLNPYINCILKYFHKMKPKHNNLSHVFEQNLQHFVFRSVLINKHKSVIEELKLSSHYILLNGRKLPSAELSNSYSTVLLSEFIPILEVGNISDKEFIHMIDRCVAILEKNVTILE